MAFDAYTSGAGVDEGAGEDKRNITKVARLPRRLVYPGYLYEVNLMYTGKLVYSGAGVDLSGHRHLPAR